MKTCLIPLLAALGVSFTVDASAPIRVADFDSDRELGLQIVNDTVMGGRSDSRFSVRNGQLTFSGNLNTNGGGFASVRAAPQAWDLGNRDRVQLRVRGDGRSYQVRLHSSRSRTTWKATFATRAGQWQVVEVDLADFQATWRGQTLDLPPPTAADVDAVGLLLADGLDGPFSVDIDWIAFAGATTDAPR